MTLPYLLKLLCLSLASFFLIHLVLALVVKSVTSAALRLAARIEPVWAARLLFWLRVLPAGLGILFVAGLCVPSYLWLEPRTATAEETGWVCLVFSILSATLWAVSMARGSSALARSVRYLQRCRRDGQKTELPGERWPVWMVDEPAALFAIAGVTRPNILISRPVLSLLTGDELSAGLRHERAHWTSRDNLKRLALLLAPDFLPFLNGFATLERGWARYTERAADDRAVAGDAGVSLSLATALVRITRLGIAPETSSLVTPLLADDGDLPGRVERLLTASPHAEGAGSWMGCLVAGAAVLLSGGVIALGLQPGLLHPVQRFLEHLIQ